ncbi:MAG: hypothetical protein JWP89_4152 [Schlesneria sp.]|nr:hypothetical protein [Schlesneria sp.]
MTDASTELAKKRIMFIKSEDFNFIAYNILVVLDVLKCDSSVRPFKDHRKLSFLVDFASSPVLAPMLERQLRLKSDLSRRDVHTLAVAYASGASRKHFVARIVNSLITKGFVEVRKGEHDLDLDVWIKREKVPETFISSDLYLLERENIKKVAAISSHIRTLTFPTFLDRFFERHGVTVWHS